MSDKPPKVTFDTTDEEWQPVKLGPTWNGWATPSLDLDDLSADLAADPAARPAACSAARWAAASAACAPRPDLVSAGPRGGRGGLQENGASCVVPERMLVGHVSVEAALRDVIA